MNQHFVYKTEGKVCATEISFDLMDGIIRNLAFVGGCQGNTKGIEKLVEGMEAQDVIQRLKGVECHGESSCPNELANAIETCLKG